MQFKIRTLTPIWTGDSEGISRTARETGLIGSLRWWYEGLMRARGAAVCDPTSGGCQYDEDTKLKDVCAVCRLFGCTGWARKFRLTVEGLQPQPWSVAAAPEVYNMHRGWLERIYVRDKPAPQVLWGPVFRMDALPRRPGPEEEAKIQAALGPLLRLVETCGALGAKTQNGYGMIAVEEPAFPRDGYLPWPDLEDAARGKPTDGTFDLRGFFGLDIEVPNPGVYRQAKRIGAQRTGYDATVIPCAYDIRFKSASEDWRIPDGGGAGLRPWLKARFGQRLHDQGLADLLGSPARDSERRASRIHVSHLYKVRAADQGYRLRIWGAIPQNLDVKPRELAEAVAEFICQPRGMFPGSRVLVFWDWEAMENGI